MARGAEGWFPASPLTEIFHKFLLSITSSTSWKYCRINPNWNWNKNIKHHFYPKEYKTPLLPKDVKNWRHHWLHMYIFFFPFYFFLVWVFFVVCFGFLGVWDFFVKSAGYLLAQQRYPSALKLLNVLKIFPPIQRTDMFVWIVTKQRWMGSLGKAHKYLDAGGQVGKGGCLHLEAGPWNVAIQNWWQSKPVKQGHTPQKG